MTSANEATARVKILQRLVQCLIDSKTRRKGKQESIDYSYFSHKFASQLTPVINQNIRVTLLRDPKIFVGRYTSCLSVASRCATIRDVKWIVEELAADVTVRNDVGQTALHEACSSNIDVSEKIRFLVFRDRRLLLMPTVYGTLPVHTASRRRDTEALETLLSLVDDITLNVTTRQGLTPLHVSAQFGRVDNIKLLLGRDGIDINAQDVRGDTPLHHAVACKRLDTVVSIATDPRCLPEVTNCRKQTAIQVMDGALKLMYSIKCLPFDKFDLSAIDRYPGLRDEHGNNVLHVACSSAVDGDKKVRAIVQRHGHLNGQANKRNDLPIHHAAVNPDSKVLRVLLNNEYAPCMRVNAPNDVGQTPLHFAVAANAGHNVTYLVLHPLTDVNAQDIDGNTPCHHAAKAENDGIIMRLETHKLYRADVTNNVGVTARKLQEKNQLLLDFSLNGVVRNVDVMIAQGAQPITDKHGNTPLHLAAKSNIHSWDKIRLIMHLFGELCKKQNNEGLCPVHVLVKHGNIHALATMLRANSLNVNLLDSHHQTPLHHAVLHNRFDMLNILVTWPDVDAKLQNTAGETAFDLAGRLMHRDMLIILLSATNLQMPTNQIRKCAEQMQVLDLQREIKRAAAVIKHAKALVVTAGSGMSVDSGLPNFRSDEQFWMHFPQLKGRTGLRHDIDTNAALFELDPSLIWGFYGHRYNMYVSTEPHQGYRILLNWAKQKPLGYFVFTTNVDGHFQRAGFDENAILEDCGSINHLQAVDITATKEIWPVTEGTVYNVDMDTLRMRGELPKIKHKDVPLVLARPNIYLKCDTNFIWDQKDEQTKRFEAFEHRVAAQCEKLPGVNVDKPEVDKPDIVIIEIGVNPANLYMNDENSLLISRDNYMCARVRINPLDAEIDNAENEISLPMGALAALREIDKHLSQ